MIERKYINVKNGEWYFGDEKVYIHVINDGLEVLYDRIDELERPSKQRHTFTHDGNNVVMPNGARHSMPGSIVMWVNSYVDTLLDRIERQARVIQQFEEAERDRQTEDAREHNTAPLKKPVDTVNSPAHYTRHPSGVECIDIAEHMGFNIGNVIKYCWRHGNKGDSTDARTDLEKASWYLNRELERISNGSK